MEIPIEILLAKVLDLAVEETISTIMDSKCCMWSKKKWRKVMKHIHRRSEVRAERFEEAIQDAKSDASSDIFDYANTIGRVRVTHI